MSCVSAALGHSPVTGLNQIPNPHTTSPLSSHTQFYQLIRPMATMPEITRLQDQQTTIPLQSTSALTSTVDPNPTGKTSNHKRQHHSFDAYMQSIGWQWRHSLLTGLDKVLQGPQSSRGPERFCGFKKPQNHKYNNDMYESSIS